MAAMLGSANLGPSVFLSFCYNVVKHGPFATKFCTQSVTDNVNKNAANLVTISFLLSRVCIYCR